MNNSIPPLKLNPLPSSPPPQKEAVQPVKAERITFDAGAIKNAQALMQAPDNLKNVLIGKLIEAPAFCSKEGEVAADIINHLLPSFLNDPNKFASDLLNNINKKEAPQFLDNLGGDSAKFPKESWKALLKDKSALKNVFTALDQALTTAEGATSNVALLKPLIDKIGDGKSSAATPAVASEATNPKKLLTLAGNTLKIGSIGAGIGTICFGAVVSLTDLAGVTDLIPGVGPNKGVTPPPGQVITNDVMKEISSFPGKDLSKETQSTIQDRIDTNLNKLPPTFSMRPTAYIEDTKKPVSPNGQVIGVQVEAQVDTNPIKIIYQESTTGSQITIIPEKNQNGDIMVKIIKVPAGGTPTVEEQTGR
jgi:hypothetical protein